MEPLVCPNCGAACRERGALWECRVCPWDSESVFLDEEPHVGIPVIDELEQLILDEFPSLD